MWWPTSGGKGNTNGYLPCDLCDKKHGTVFTELNSANSICKEKIAMSGYNLWFPFFFVCGVEFFFGFLIQVQNYYFLAFTTKKYRRNVMIFVYDIEIASFVFMIVILKIC